MMQGTDGIGTTGGWHSTSNVRIAHLSDVHMPPTPVPAWREANLKRGLGFANWWLKRVRIHRADVLAKIVEHLRQESVMLDHILVSGDLVNLGLPREHATAARWLDSLGPPDRVAVVPGNHDIYTDIGGDPGVARWAAYMASDSAGRRLAGSETSAPAGPFPFLRIIRGCAIIGVNSAVPTPPGYAYGTIGSRQMDRLAEVLQSTKAAGLFRLVMLHHPPMQRPDSARRGLRDARELEAIFARLGADLVIHGHNHLHEEAWLAGPDRRIPVIGVASASAGAVHHGEPLAAYNVYEISTAGRGGLIRRKRFGIEHPDGPVVELAASQPLMEPVSH